MRVRKQWVCDDLNGYKLYGRKFSFAQFAKDIFLFFFLCSPVFSFCVSLILSLLPCFSSVSLRKHFFRFFFPVRSVLVLVQTVQWFSSNRSNFVSAFFMLFFFIPNILIFNHSKRNAMYSADAPPTRIEISKSMYSFYTHLVNPWNKLVPFARCEWLSFRFYASDACASVSVDRARSSDRIDWADGKPKVMGDIQQNVKMR